jgi:hypothetical protein
VGIVIDEECEECHPSPGISKLFVQRESQGMEGKEEGCIANLCIINRDILPNLNSAATGLKE